MELRNKVRQAFLQSWDPMGVQNFPELQNEYDMLIKPVVEILRKENSLQDLFEHLWSIETAYMGLRGNQKKTRAFAEELYKLKI